MALEARIKALLALEDNRKCVDCGTRSPRWASYSLGVFLCLQCAGFHRSLGVHISRVKSCDFDRWAEDQVRAMESVGNARGREEYGPSYAEVHRTNYLPDAASLESFIRVKYARRKYARGGTGAPFNTPVVSAGRPPMLEEDLCGDFREPPVDSNSKIRYEWPRKPAAATATYVKGQQEASLIDLFESAPVQQQQPTAAAALDLFAADFAAPTAPVAAAATAAAAAVVHVPFGAVTAGLVTAAPKLPPAHVNGFALMPQHQQQQMNQAQPQVDDLSLVRIPPAPTQAQPQVDDLSLFRIPSPPRHAHPHVGDLSPFCIPPPPRHSQLPVNGFARMPQQPSLHHKSGGFDMGDDFGAFVASAAQNVQQQPGAKLQPTKQLYPTLSLFGGEDDVPPPLPAKDYDPFASVALPVRDYPGAPEAATRPVAAAATRPVAAAADASLVGLFASAVTLSPTGATCAPLSPPPAPSGMSTADIMSLYGQRSATGAGPMQPPAMPAFLPSIGGPGASRA